MARVKPKLSEDSNDAQFCWEQVSKTNRLFRISRLFAAPHTISRLVPLYALFSGFERICSDISDESVARSSLGWWHQECVAGDAAESAHPVLRELRRSGAAKFIDKQDYEALLIEAWNRLDPEPPTDLASLRERCERAARRQLEMEIRVCGAENLAAASLKGVAAQAGLVQLLREHRERWLPLDLLARHGVKRTALAEKPCAGAVKAMMRELAEAACDWSREGLGKIGPGGQAESVRHLAVISALHSRKLGQLGRSGSRDYAAELNRPRLLDALSAWRTARNFNRR